MTEGGDTKASALSLLAEHDRPRERAFRLGVGSLTDVELLAVLLRSGTASMPVMELSASILAECGGRMADLARMDIPEMTRRFKGVGAVKALGLAAAIELGNRCRAEELATRRAVRSSTDIFELVRDKMQHLSNEEFWMVTLNRSLKVTGTYRISSGGTTATVVDVKIIVRRALDKLAECVAIAHNHPSGNPQPSAQDDVLTKRVGEALKLLDIKLIDHIIVAGANHYSYSDNGRLP